MGEKNKIKIKFHNPNNQEQTRKYLTKVIATVTVEKYLNITPKNINNLLEYDRKTLLSTINTI